MNCCHLRIEDRSRIRVDGLGDREIAQPAY